MPTKVGLDLVRTNLATYVLAFVEATDNRRVRIKRFASGSWQVEATLNDAATNVPPALGFSSATSQLLLVYVDKGTHRLRYKTSSNDGSTWTASAELVADPGLEDPSVVLRIIDRSGEEGVRAVFQHLMASGDIAARRRYYDACLRLKAGTRVFMEYLNHSLWYVVRNAASLLGETNAEVAVPALGRLLKHEEERVRIAAVVALGQIGGPDAMSRLEKSLHDPSLDVRRRVMSILFTNQEHWSELDGSDPVNDIERDEALRLEMVRALGRVNTQAAAQKLQRMVEGQGNDSTLELRLAAMDALVQGHRALAMQVLPKYAYDPFPTIRAKVAQLLG